MLHSVGNPVFTGMFVLVVLLLLLIDMGVFHRRAHAVRFKEALAWSGIWVVLSVCFGVWVYRHFGRQPGLEFFAGYLIEYSLSIDNIFVFILIFSYFKVPARLHHKILFWGILGALFMRATFILSGAALIRRFEWILYLFGGFLVYTGYKMLREGEKNVEPEKNPFVRHFRKLVPMITDYGSGKFFIKQAGKVFATPLALVLVTVETTDLIFATDSIPAIFGVTTDPFIVYTSNICAILGLRSMYFLLATVVDKFVYLGKGISMVLIFIGIKMLLADLYKIPIVLSLAVVASILAGSVLLSLIFRPRKLPDSSNSGESLVTFDSPEK
jgi:tellurite resistance protein TerC